MSGSLGSPGTHLPYQSMWSMTITLISLSVYGSQDSGCKPVVGLELVKLICSSTWGHEVMVAFSAAPIKMTMESDDAQSPSGGYGVSRGLCGHCRRASQGPSRQPIGQGYRRGEGTDEVRAPAGCL